MDRPIFEPLFSAMMEQQASDMYLTVGFPPSIRVNDQMIPLGQEFIDDTRMKDMLSELLDEEQLDEYDSTLEFNTALNWDGKARFRINVFRQQQHDGIVIRRIQTEIPTTQSLGLPETYNKLAMLKRGLILVVGPTGSGKSSSLAAMVGYRNANGSGHIITIEDPIEFVHQHKGCIVSQRDIGIDTYSFGMALKNALRQRPDVVLIGEIRDRETMEHAINFAETGHLVMGTLHANNSNQAVERVLNFFPEDKHTQIRMNLALNLRAILSQRLVTTRNATKTIAIEMLLNTGLIKNLIEEGKIKEIKEVMEKNRDQGMQTFDQHLLDLFTAGVISEEMALAESDNSANLKLHIKQYVAGERLGGLNKKATAASDTTTTDSDASSGSVVHHFKV